MAVCYTNLLNYLMSLLKNVRALFFLYMMTEDTGMVPNLMKHSYRIAIAYSLLRLIYRE
jgi:hypothetical protein